MAAKVSKASVHYRRSAWWGGPCCGTCVMFVPFPGVCTLVSGRIRPGDMCDRWEAK